MSVLSIEFDRPHRSYKPGETITLTIRLNLKSPKAVSSIYVRIQGKSDVSYTEGKVLKETDVMSDEYFTGSNGTVESEETHFIHYETLVGDRDTNTTGKLISLSKILYLKQNIT